MNKEDTDLLCKVLGLTPAEPEEFHLKGGYKDLQYTYLHSDGQERLHNLGCGKLSVGWLMVVAERNNLTISFTKEGCTVSGDAGTCSGRRFSKAIVQYLESKWCKLGEETNSQYPIDQAARPNWCSIY